MKKCVSCKQAVSNSDTKCPHCGAKIEGKLRCPQCHSENFETTTVKAMEKNSGSNTALGCLSFYFFGWLGWLVAMNLKEEIEYICKDCGCHFNSK